MNNIEINIPLYKIIQYDELLYKLGINPYCVNEGCDRNEKIQVSYEDCLKYNLFEGSSCIEENLINEKILDLQTKIDKLLLEFQNENNEIITSVIIEKEDVWQNEYNLFRTTIQIIK